MHPFEGLNPSMLGGARPSRMVASQLPGAKPLPRTGSYAQPGICSQPSLSGRAELFGGMAVDPSEAVDTLVDDLADLEIDEDLVHLHVGTQARPPPPGPQATRRADVRTR